MPRFVLVDHSITGLAGHHYEYAVHVLRAAQRGGYEPVLVTNRKFNHNDLPWRVLPLFEFGFWPAARLTVTRKIAVAALSRLAPRIAVLRIRWRYSELALAWSSRFVWPQYLLRKRGEGAPPLKRAAALATVLAANVLLLPLLAVGLLIGALVAPLWMAYYLIRCAASAGWAILHLRWPSLLAAGRSFISKLRSVVRSVLRPGPMVEQFVGRFLAQRAAPPPAWRPQAEAFGRDAGRMLKLLAPDDRDLLFFPTLSEHDLEGLVEHLDKLRQPPSGSWHFLFRRNIYTGSRSDYAAQDAGLEPLRLVFERVRRSVLAGRSFFYTDTDELSEQHNRLGIMPFHTLPVPHTHHVADRPPRSGPLRLTYLGDARTEKGFALLPDVAAKLEADYLATGKAKLVLQCNYNIPGGEPHVAIARGELESLPAKHVELHPKPLTSDEYRHLLLSADVNLLCYDRTNYYARSSGILVESLAAGIPVIVPGGCWLSWQFLERQIAYVEEIRNEIPRVGAKAMTDLWWQEAGKPPAMLKPGEILRVCRGTGPREPLEAPLGATHMVVRADFAVAAQSVIVTITEIGWDDHPISERDVYIDTVADNTRGAVLVNLRADVPKISLRLRSRSRGESAWLKALAIEFLRAPEGRPVALGAVGLSYASESEIPTLVADVIDHYPHYQRTAVEFSERWRDYHNSDRLLRDMERAAGIPHPDGTARLARVERVAV